MNSSDLDELNIRHFKLSSGDEIIGHVVKTQELTITVERPLQINIVTVNSSQKFFLSEWLPISKNKIAIISAYHIITHSEVDPSSKEAYIKYCLDLTDLHNQQDEPTSDIDLDKLVPDNKTLH